MADLEETAAGNRRRGTGVHTVLPECIRLPGQRAAIGLADNETYTGGAHGMSWVSSYNVNPETGEFYEFRDLFRNPEEAIPEITG